MTPSPSAPSPSREASKAPTGQPTIAEAMARSKAGPIGILHPNFTPLVEIFPEGIPLKSPFPRPHGGGTPVFILDPDRCTPEALLRLSGYLADAARVHGVDSDAESVLAAIAAGQEITIDRGNIHAVTLIADIKVLPCPCPKCTAAREAGEGLVS